METNQLNFQQCMPQNFDSMMSTSVNNDLQLYEEIERKLSFQPGVDPNQVKFSVHEGATTIHGVVDNYLVKRLIKQMIRSIAGIKAIADEMSVKPVNQPLTPILLK